MKKIVLLSIFLLFSYKASICTGVVVRAPIPAESPPSTQIITDLAPLNKEFRNKVILLLVACNREGLKVKVYETLRTPQRQDSLYLLRPRVTYLKGGESKHQYGLAVDLYTKNKRDYKKIGMIAESLGLTWGGRWKMRDLPHIEWPLSTAEIIAGARPEPTDLLIIPI